MFAIGPLRQLVSAPELEQSGNGQRGRETRLTQSGLAFYHHQSEPDRGLPTR
jgi:hypothetical protein